MDGSIEDVRVKGTPDRAIRPRVAASPIMTTNWGRNIPETLPNRMAMKKKVSINTMRDMVIMFFLIIGST